MALNIFFILLSGRVILVPDSAPTIQAGLHLAGYGDTVLVSPGTYYENIVWPGVDGIKLYSIAGPESTVIDARQNGRVVVFGSTLTRATELRGFTITGGLATAAAGIYCQGSPTITGNRIVNNQATGGHNYGAGIFCSGPGPLIQGNEISRNISSGSATWNYGAGIYVDYNSSPEICYNLIKENECSQGYWNYGAGIWCGSRSNPFIYQNVIINNVNTGGDRGHGAGIAVESQGQALIFNNLIIGNRNTSGYWNYGAGIRVAGKAAIINNTITGNICSGGNWAYGGGIFVDYQDSALAKNNIIAENSATSGGGIYNSSGFVYNLFNDVWNNTGGNYYGCAAGPGDISADPLFVTGVYGNYYLSQRAAGQPQTSPCVDAADTLLWNWPANLDSLLRSWTTRTDSVPDAGLLDMGYHYPTGLTVGIKDVRNNITPAPVSAVPTVFSERVVFTTSLRGPVELTILDPLGRKVYRTRGTNQFIWNGAGVARGVYFYRLTTGTQTATGRLVKL